MKQQRLTRRERENLELIRESQLFDETYYLTTYPDVEATGMDPLVHFLLLGGRDGRDPSPQFSSVAYLDRYRDVKDARWNPLVHFLRMGRQEGRLLNPLVDDARLISESGMFDAEYYGDLLGDAEPGLDLIRHYLTTGASDGLDPSEQFSTLTYVRMYPELASSGMNPLVHYLRHGRSEGRQIVRGRPRSNAFRTMYDVRWPELAAIPVVRVAGAGPRVTLLLEETTLGTSDEGADQTSVVLAMQLADRIGASLRLASRRRPPDAWAVHAAQLSSNVSFAGHVELVHLPPDGVNPLLMGDRDIVLACGWRAMRAAVTSTVTPREVVGLLLEDPAAVATVGDEQLLCHETLAWPDTLTLVRGDGLRTHLVARHPSLASTMLSFEPAFPAPALQGRESNRTRRRLLLHADPASPSHLYWRSVEAVSSALEQGVIDPTTWTVVCVRSGASEVMLPRGVRIEMVEAPGEPFLSGDDVPADAALVLRWASPATSLVAVALAARGVPVLTNGEPQASRADISENILTSSLDVDSLVGGLGRLVHVAGDDDQRRRNRDEDHICRDWAAATREALDAVQSRFETTRHDVH